jgi:hypothetical protein
MGFLFLVGFDLNIHGGNRQFGQEGSGSINHGDVIGWIRILAIIP